ncbi:hypothetical protein [Clostridium hydrogenum]|uniref:hypothetical protein n=1 Tax=Clostridium hydrogenum TaxID=2855764 RepID=UPI001F372F2B|nr:hypothetical protein [Clostridium hydrogenum]
MKKCTVISDGDKIKAIRIKYNLRQDEISGKDITRNLISEIETDKANITKKTAEIIIKNLKEVGKNKGFEISETVEYLMENQTVQATKIFDKYINELKTFMVCKDNSFTDTLKDAESFLADWNITDRMQIIYELAGDYYCNQDELSKAIVYYEKAITLVGKLFLSQELLSLLSKLSKTYGNAGRYSEAIDCCDFVLNRFKNLSERDTVYFMYNRAYVFFLLKNYERVLADINKIERFIDRADTQRYFKILDTKAVSLHELKRYDEALKLYNGLLDILEDGEIDKKLVIYINMSEVYIGLSDIDKANNLLSEVKKELPFIKNNSRYEDNIYYEIGKIYTGLKDNVRAAEYYSKALEVAKKRKNYVLTADILYGLMECEETIERVDSIKKEVFLLSSKQEKLTDKLIYKLIDFYADNNIMDKVKEINKFALQFA